MVGSYSGSRSQSVALEVRQESLSLEEWHYHWKERQQALNAGFRAGASSKELEAGVSTAVGVSRNRSRKQSFIDAALLL